MKWINYILIGFGLMVGFTINAQVPTPQEQKFNTILFKGGSAHIGNGQYIDNSAIGIKEGKIAVVTNALTYTIVKEDWDTIIDITGKHVYPGFIAPNSTLGLTEIDAVRASRDFHETGEYNPNVRALIAVNMDSKVMHTVRTNGVLVEQATPRGGTISGSSSIMALDGWNWEDAAYKIDDGIHLNWPDKYIRTGWWAEPGPTSDNKNYATDKQEIYSFFEEARAYSKKSNPEKMDLKFEAMRGLFKGKKRLYIHADFAPEINDIIDFSREFDFEYPVIVGGYDSYRLANRLKENRFTVMIGKPHSLPEFEDDYTFAWYRLAYLLQEAGVLFCIQNAGDMEAMNTRNLPFLAGTAWAYGLTEEQAVASITLNAAKIMGIDDRLGSLEKGKDATLYISEGNALEMTTNKAFMAMVKGRFVVMDNHQMQLYRQYKKKYGLTELD